MNVPVISAFALKDRILDGDLLGVKVVIYVSLNYEFPRLLVDIAKITGLF